MNVLVSDDGRALIADFGLSHIAVGSAMKSSNGLGKGTTRWTAPELLQDDDNARQSSECDMWSFGCLCYEVKTSNRLLYLHTLIRGQQVLTNKIPFYHLNEIKVTALLVTYSRNTPVLPGAIDDVKIDEQIRDVIKKCWNFKPHDRPTCDFIRTTIASIDIQDTRPKTTTNPENGLSFLQAMGANVDFQLDYNNVRKILHKVRRGRWPNAKI